MNRHGLIFGLGNPGPVYERTRHNLGAMAVSRFAQALGLTMKINRSLGVAMASYPLLDGTLYIARSLGFMNHSGQALKLLLREYPVELSRLLIVHDDARLMFGQGQWQQGGPQRGQNGLRSIVQVLGSESFCRLRLGVANEQCHAAQPDYSSRISSHVLAPMTSEEWDQTPRLLDLASSQMQIWAEGGRFENFCLPTQSC